MSTPCRQCEYARSKTASTGLAYVCVVHRDTACPDCGAGMEENDWGVDNDGNPTILMLCRHCMKSHWFNREKVKA